MSYQFTFTVEEMENAAKKSVERLRVLSEAGEYTPEYYSVHRTLKNLKRRGIGLDLTGLSEEETAYLTKECFDIPLETLMTFKSSMRFYYILCHYKYSVAYGEPVDYPYPCQGEPVINNPECWLRENDYSVEMMQLTSQEAIAMENTECPEIISRLIEGDLVYFRPEDIDIDRLIKKYIDAIEKEFGFFPMSNVAFVAEKYIQIRNLEKEVAKIQSQMLHLQHLPPQQISCPECSHEIEVCYDTTTEELKDHFQRVCAGLDQ